MRFLLPPRAAPGSRSRSPMNLKDPAHPDRPTTEGRRSLATGTVKWFNAQKGFGFIQPDDGSNDVFVHISAVERAGMGNLREAQRVRYDIEQDRRGRASATNLSAGRRRRDQAAGRGRRLALMEGIRDMAASDLSSGAFRLLRTLSVMDVARRFSEKEAAELVDGGYAEFVQGRLVITEKGKDLKRAVQDQPRQAAP